MVISQTLVLNASLEPIHIVSWQRAIQLLFQGKVEVLEESNKKVRSVKLTIKVPLVLKLINYVPLHKKSHSIKFTRTNIFLRDSYQCQYCHKKHTKTQLTLDHVLPIVQGGRKRWENIVTACKKCNQKKGGRTPEQAGLKLKKNPTKPIWLPKERITLQIKYPNEKWKIYLQFE